MKSRYLLFIAGVLALSAACDRNPKHEATATAPNADRSAPSNDLDDQSQDVLAGVIVQACDALLNGHGVLEHQPLKLSDALNARLQKYPYSDVEFRMTFGGVTAPIYGEKLTIPQDGAIDAQLTGPINYDVRLTAGEVGIVDGSVFVKEGTVAIINTVRFVFRADHWKKEADGV
jgi:hypothetical protein